MTRTFAFALGVTLLLGGTQSMSADEKPTPGCKEGASRQFDFWIGAVARDGKRERWPVTTASSASSSGCALLENWTGAKGGEGKSLNFFDRDDGLWHQTWIDRSGGALFLSGKFENGAMRMEGGKSATDKQPATRHRITWSALA